MQHTIDISKTPPNIRELQFLLLGLSYTDPDIPRIAITGVWNEQTAAALLAFQNRYALEQTGVVDLNTWERLVSEHEKSASRFQAGAPLYPLYNPFITESIEDFPLLIEFLQAVLRTLSEIGAFYPPIAVTGVWDQATASAVTVIQSLWNLKTTGKLDLPTWNAIAEMFNLETRKQQSIPPTPPLSPTSP